MENNNPSAQEIIEKTLTEMKWNGPEMADVTNKHWNHMPRKRKGMKLAITYECLEGSSVIPELYEALRKNFPHQKFAVNRNALNYRNDGQHHYIIQLL